MSEHGNEHLPAAGQDGSHDSGSGQARRQASGPGAIGQQAFGGVVWTLGQTLGSKVAGLAQQVVLAKVFLSEADFGLFAMAQVVISLASLGQQLGVGEILVRRHRRFDRWAESALGLNLAAGMVGLVMVLAVVPIWPVLFEAVARLLGRGGGTAPAIQGLLAVGALALPLDAVGVVPQARLRIDMRFRALAALWTVNAIGMAALSITLAWLGWGAYSLIVPLPILAAYRAAAAFWLAPIRIGLRRGLQRWGWVLLDARYFLVTSFFGVFLTQGDYLLTRLFFTDGVMGAYYYAYTMSMQTSQLISGNLIAVLLPSFAKLDEDAGRQAAAYERTCATIVLVGAPMCFLQALLAGPVFHLLFGSKWDSAVPLFEVLSVGMAFSMPGAAAWSLLMAQGRYRFQMVWMIVASMFYLVFVACGALCGSVYHVAVFVLAYLMIFGPLGVVLPVLRAKVAVARLLWRVYGFGLLSGGAAAGGGWVLSQVWHGGNVGVAAVRGAGWLTVFGATLLALRPPEARDVVERVRVILRRHGVTG